MSDWMRDAACRTLTPEEADRVFFPIEVMGDDTVWAEARALCGTCPVATDCLDSADTNNIEHGVWGGRTPAERGIVDTARTLLPCGTTAAWHRGCRCDECVAVKRAYTAQQMRERRRAGAA